MGHALTNIADYLANQSLHILMVFALVAAGCWLLRKASAHWRYLLWLIVLLKCLTPPIVAVPLAVLPQDRPPVVEHTSAPLTAGRVGMPDRQVLPDEQGEGGTAFRQTLPASEGRQVPAGLAAADGYTPEQQSAASEDPVRLSLAQWLAIGWVAGAVLFGLFVLVRAWRIARHLKRTRRPIGAELAAQVADLAGRLGLKNATDVWLVYGFSQPFVWGLLRGSVYLPVDFEGVQAEHRRQILTHELAHVLRWDASVNVLQVLVQGVFFFHPLVWWTNRKIRQEREKCCDETAIAALDSRPKQYGTAIVDVLAAEHEAAHAVPSLAVAGPAKNIEERVKTIMSPDKRFYKRPTALAVVTALLLGIIAVPTALILTTQAGCEDGTSDKPIASPDPASAYIEVRQVGDEKTNLETLKMSYVWTAKRASVLKRAVEQDVGRDGNPSDRIRKTDYFKTDKGNIITRLQEDVVIRSVPNTNLIEISMKNGGRTERPDIINAVALALVTEIRRGTSSDRVERIRHLQETLNDLRSGTGKPAQEDPGPYGRFSGPCDAGTPKRPGSPTSDLAIGTNGLGTGMRAVQGQPERPPRTRAGRHAGVHAAGAGGAREGPRHSLAPHHEGQTGDRKGSAWQTERTRRKGQGNVHPSGGRQ